MENFISLLVTLALLALGYGAGTYFEKKHYRSIHEREAATLRFPVISFATLPEGWRPMRAALTTGSVVISLDYFKRFLASLRNIFGGRISAYETLLDRARREAILRMKEDAIARGYDAIINVRIETSRLASARADGKGTAGVEILAFGTAIKRAPAG